MHLQQLTNETTDTFHNGPIKFKLSNHRYQRIRNQNIYKKCWRREDLLVVVN